MFRANLREDLLNVPATELARFAVFVEGRVEISRQFLGFQLQEDAAEQGELAGAQLLDPFVQGLPEAGSIGRHSHRLYHEANLAASDVIDKPARKGSVLNSEYTDTELVENWLSRQHPLIDAAPAAMGSDNLV